MKAYILSTLALLLISWQYPMAATHVPCKFDESRRNDNYCDCPATSEDETETSACAPVGMFKCRDRKVYFPTSRVGDGVCDCCDGSDEAAGACPNTCEELDRIERQKQQEIEERKRRGIKGFMELYEKAQQSCIEKSQQKSQEKKEEEEEAAKDQQPVVTRKDLRAAERLRDKLEKEYEASIRKSRIESLQLSKLSREDLADILVELATESNQGTKLERLLASRLPCASKDQENSEEEGEEDNEEDDDEVEEDGDLDENMIGEEDGPYGEDPDPSKTKKTASNNDDDKEDDDDSNEAEDECEPLWTEEVPPAPTELEEARTKAREMRERWDSLNDDEESTDNSDDFANEKEIDFGPVQVWRGLYKECFTLKKDKYTYQMCTFGEFTQDHVRLGKFTRWGRENDYSGMLYEGGERCYSPAIPRSIKVKVECGETSELVDVFEPSTCVYEAVFRTPAACVPDVLPPLDGNTCSSSA